MQTASPAQKSRRHSALVNLAQKRSSISTPVNLNCLVRVYLLDGSTKLLQMQETSTAKDVLISLKFNLDLEDISTFALFRVTGTVIRRVELSERVTDTLRDPTKTGQDVRLLFRSWITYRYGGHEKCVFQEGIRVKQPNTALWLSFMEAAFMCMTGKYYLTEEESLMLGCLKMQSEFGDFNPAVHSLQRMKERVMLRFPNPIRSRMRYLCSANQSNNGFADDLAVRVQSIYARIAGKLKLEAQIDFLNCLRMWCPFYGCSFYEVQCQYDSSPLDTDSTPPVLTMNAAVGPQAVFLITATEPPVIMRHAYNRIVKWITHIDKHIFAYWVLKPEVKLADINQQYKKETVDSTTTDGSSSSSIDFDVRQFCDCVYLVTPLVKELEYLVYSYVQCRRDIAPHLLGAPIELRSNNYNSSSTTTTSPSNTSAATLSPPPAPPSTPNTVSCSNSPRKSSTSRIGSFFSSLGAGVGGSNSSSTMNKRGSNSSSSGHHNGVGTGLNEDDIHNIEMSGDNSNTGGGNMSEQGYGDDTAAIANSFFKNMYKKGGLSSTKDAATAAEEEEEEELAHHLFPEGIRFASAMSELCKVAAESSFSDDDEEDDHDSQNDDDDSSSDSGSDGSSNHSNNNNKQHRKNKTNKPSLSSSSSSAVVVESKKMAISPAVFSTPHKISSNSSSEERKNMKKIEADEAGPAVANITEKQSTAELISSSSPLSSVGKRQQSSVIGLMFRGSKAAGGSNTTNNINTTTTTTATVVVSNTTTNVTKDSSDTESDGDSASSSDDDDDDDENRFSDDDEIAF